MFNTFNKPPEEQDDGWFERQKAAIERYAEDVRLRAAGTSREQIAAEAQAAAERKAAEDKALLETMMREKFDQLPEGQKDIYSEFAAQMDQKLAVERAKSKAQLDEDKLNRENEADGAQLEQLVKNYSANRAAIEAIEARIRERDSQLKQISASKPYEPSNKVINFYSANANSHSTGGGRR